PARVLLPAQRHEQSAAGPGYQKHHHRRQGAACCHCAPRQPVLQTLWQRAADGAVHRI
ncbi:hypothetical protein GGH99_006990, partial [Coemansia sp. RSA 1285]